MSIEGDDYTLKLRLLGGRGNAAIWQWEVYAPGGLLPLMWGKAKGAERNASEAGRRAMLKLRQYNGGSDT